MSISQSDRSRRVLVPTLVTLAAFVFLGSVFTNLWTERLWFASVGFGSVFNTVLATRIVLFLGFGLLFAATVCLNAWLAWRYRPALVRAQRGDPAVRYRAALTPVARPVLIVLGLVMALLSGTVAAGQWKTFQLWWHGGSFGIKDAHFHKDIGFFVFDYPWLRYLDSYAFSLLVFTVLVVLGVHYIFGGIRFAPRRGPQLSRAAQVQIAVLLGLVALVKAVGYYLDRFGLAVTSSRLFDGIGYTDAHARIPSKNILVVVAVVCALLLFSAIVSRSWTLPITGLALMIVTSVLIGGIWPYAMQSFQVKPSEPDKEGPYIAKNIAATRAAYGVADAKVEPYSASTSLSTAALRDSADQRVSSRLLDPTLISEAFEQLQQVRGYYTVQSTLDVDRYALDGQGRPQDVIIAAREINLNGLQPGQRNWANDHTVYTHGYGVIAARGNQRGDQGEPVWVAKDIPPKGELQTDQPPRIYFGENSPDYSIVGAPRGGKPVEVDIPRGESDASATQNTYDGSGGVSIGGLFHRLLYAVKFAEPNIVLSSRVNAESKILYDRHPGQRVEKVAPWLTVDGDVYPAIVDGRLVWIVDGYTTSDSYPYSEHRSLREATADTLTSTAAQLALPTDQVNYMRNSVKAVVDAYDGSVKLYEWDTKDPVLKAWEKVFPGTVEPRSAIKAGLLEHLRYPVDLFKVQRNVLARYHVTDAQTFYEDGERWRVPNDPASGTAGATLQPPYYLTMARPGETRPDFSLTSVFLPNSRQNLAAFVSVDSEATDPNYGKMQILQLPSDTQVSGPSQMANQIQTDKGVTQALLQFEQAKEAKILRGNLLTLPVGGALLYVQPVYIQRNNAEGTFPVLQFVAASFGDHVGFGQTLDEALRVALGLSEAQAPDTGSPTPSTPGKAKTTQQWLEAASNSYNAAQDALKKGDLAGYQRNVDEMNKSLEQAQQSLR